VTFHAPLRNAACNCLQHAHVAIEAGQAPFEIERVLETTQVAGGIVHVGLLHST
jgi:hypothetical protein